MLHASVSNAFSCPPGCHDISTIISIKTHHERYENNYCCIRKYCTLYCTTIYIVIHTRVSYASFQLMLIVFHSSPSNGFDGVSVCYEWSTFHLEGIDKYRQYMTCIALSSISRCGQSTRYTLDAPPPAHTLTMNCQKPQPAHTEGATPCSQPHRDIIE
jgi:hypothetical protein